MKAAQRTTHNAQNSSSQLNLFFPEELKFLFLSLILIFCASRTLHAQEAKIFKIDPSKSQVSFTAHAKYLKGVGGYTVNGKFDDVSGQIASMNGNVLQSKVQIEVQTTSVHTDNSMRDNHLRGEEFFDSKNSPKAIFKSLSVEQAGADGFVMNGKFIIRGVPKVVSLSVKLVGQYDDKGQHHIVFQAHTVLDRTDFGVGVTPTGVFSGLMNAVISIENQIELNVTLDAYGENAL